MVTYGKWPITLFFGSGLKINNQKKGGRVRLLIPYNQMLSHIKSNLSTDNNGAKTDESTLQVMEGQKYSVETIPY